MSLKIDTNIDTQSLTSNDVDLWSRTCMVMTLLLSYATVQIFSKIYTNSVGNNMTTLNCYL